MATQKLDPRKADRTDVEVGRLVCALRMSRGFSQTDLANRIGVTFQQVRNTRAAGDLRDAKTPRDGAIAGWRGKGVCKPRLQGRGQVARGGIDLAHAAAACHVRRSMHDARLENSISYI
jgi:hypothetical protein